jgi:hypothetical protein
MTGTRSSAPAACKSAAAPSTTDQTSPAALEAALQRTLRNPQAEASSSRAKPEAYEGNAGYGRLLFKVGCEDGTAAFGHYNDSSTQRLYNDALESIAA